MKKLLLSLTLAALILPTVVFATPVSWDYTSSVLQPLRNAWTSQVKGNNFVSTSTTAINVFPNASSTNATTTNATTTNLRVSNLLTFNGVSGSTWAAFCTAITGGAGLCDGTDDTGGGGGAGLATSTPIADTYVIYGTSAGTVGAEAAFNYDDATNILTVDSGVFTNATATNLAGTNINLFGGGIKTTANAFCIQLTGAAALCDGSDDGAGGGGAASDWNQAILEGVLSPSTTVGIRVAASSTFLGALTVASTSPDYTNQIFEVATSSDDAGDLFSVGATTSVMTHTSSLLNFPQESGARISLGRHSYYGMTNPIDQYVTHGRLRNDEWSNADCVVPTWATSISTEGLTTGCDQFFFSELTTATLNNAVGTGYPGSVLSTSGNDAGFFGFTGGLFLRFPTSTPSMEVTARLTGIAAGATTSIYLIGYMTYPDVTAPTRTEPTAGCFFIASSTQANWLATCRTALGTGTIVDTGIASTTISAGSGAFRTFRIDADATQAKFYMTDNTKTMQLVATISTTYPSTTSLIWGMTVANSSGAAQTVSMTFNNVSLWFRKMIPNA